MPRDRRFQLALGLALGSSLAFLAFLAFLLARPVGEDGVRLVANLAQLLAPTLAAASCAWAAVTGAGRARRGLGAAGRLVYLLGGRAGHLGVVRAPGQAGAALPVPGRRRLPGRHALAAAAMLAFPGRAERAALQARSLLDGAVIAASLLYTSWALVLGTGLLSLAVADSAFAYLTQEGTYRTGTPSDVGWFLGYLLVAAAARRPRPSGSPGSGGGRAASRSCCRTAPWPWP